MKCSLGLANFLSHSVVFLYFFALIAEEGFLISPCYSLELCVQMLISFLFSFAFHLSSFPYLGLFLPWTWGISSLLLQQSSRCSLSWTRDISSRPPLLTWTWSSSSPSSCTRTAAACWTWGCSFGHLS